MSISDAHIAIAIISFIISFGIFVWRINITPNQDWLAGVGVFIEWGILVVYFFFTKLDLTEKGILWYNYHIKWENIASYSWTGDGNKVLTFRMKKPKFFKERKWAVTTEEKELVNQFLSERLAYIGN